MNVLIPPALAVMAPQLQEFFDVMVHKLNVNSHKDAIRDDDIDGLLSKMADEIEEFREQRIADAADPNMLNELADVGNFAFLLYAFLRAKGVRTMRERFIEEFFEVRPDEGRVYCRKTRSGSPLKVGEEVLGTMRNGRCYIRTQHSASGSIVSVSRADLVYWAKTGRWPERPLKWIVQPRNLKDDQSPDFFANLEMVPDKPGPRFPFVSQYKPRGRENNKNYGKWVYQRRHAFKLVRVGYWDSPEEAAREGIVAWKARIKEMTNA